MFPKTHEFQKLFRVQFCVCLQKIAHLLKCYNPLAHHFFTLTHRHPDRWYLILSSSPAKVRSSSFVVVLLRKPLGGSLVFGHISSCRLWWPLLPRNWNSHERTSYKRADLKLSSRLRSTKGALPTAAAVEKNFQNIKLEGFRKFGLDLFSIPGHTEAHTTELHSIHCITKSIGSLALTELPPHS